MPNSDPKVKPESNLTNPCKWLYFANMVKTRVSSKGQTTIPRQFLQRWKTSEVLWDLNPDGTARVSPRPEIMSLMGSMAGSRPRIRDEKRKTRAAIGRNAANEGRCQ